MTARKHFGTNISVNATINIVIIKLITDIIINNVNNKNVIDNKIIQALSYIKKFLI